MSQADDNVEPIARLNIDFNYAYGFAPQTANSINSQDDANMERQSLHRNLIQVAQREFKLAMKPFTAKRRKLGPALLAFENGYLSIESGDTTAVMHAEGEWHGRAVFSPEVLRAVATFPPTQNPITFAYAEGHLLIGSMTIPCQWNNPALPLIQDLTDPSLLDLLALEKTIPRSEYLGTGLGKKIRSAKEKVERRIKNAAAQLIDLEITEEEIRALIEERIFNRLGEQLSPPK